MALTIWTRLNDHDAIKVIILIWIYWMLIKNEGN